MDNIINGIESAELPLETDEQVIQRLAALSPFDYDRVREDDAKRISVRTATLDKLVKEARAARTTDDDQDDLDEYEKGVEPWDGLVQGDALLNECREVLNRHCILPDGGDVALSLWVVGSYCINSFRIFPKACLSSPEKRCGKTTTLETMGALVNKSIIASNVTPSVIFRLVDSCQPSLLIDEADTFMNGSEELRGIINSGHTKAGAFILRTEGEGADRQPKRFSTWSPMVIAMIKTPPDTIVDRSIMVTLRRKMRDESVRKIPLDLKTDYKAFRQKCTQWAIDSAMTLRISNPNTPQVSSDRAQDNWGPLLSIADLAGGEWPELARKAMLTLEDREEDEAIGPQILNDIREVFSQRDRERLSSDEIVSGLVDMEERPWCEWKRGHPLTKNSLARLLKPYSIKSKQIRFGGSNHRGYELSQFNDAFARYLPNTPIRNATSLQPSNHGACSQFQNATDKEGVALRKPVQPSNHATCNDVALRKGLNGEEDENEAYIL